MCRNFQNLNLVICQNGEQNVFSWLTADVLQLNTRKREWNFSR